MSRPRQPGSQILARALADLLARAALRLRTNTLALYRSVVNLHILPYLGRRRLRDLSERILMRYFQQLERAGVSRRLQAIAYTLLNGVFIHSGLAVNPLARIPRPRYESAKPKPYNRAEATAFLAAIDGEPDACLLYVAVTLGPRQGELAGLQCGDVDWNAGTLEIARQIQRVAGQGLVVSPLKTKAAHRRLYLSPDGLARLRRHWDALPSRAPDAPLFPSQAGTPRDPANLLKTFRALLAKHSLRPIRFHDMRHTCATLLLGQGVHPRVVSELLGHESVEITLTLYGHAIPGLQAAAAGILDDLLQPTADSN